MLATIFGFLGDALTFLGGLILALDSLFKERELKAKQNLVDMMKVLKKITLSRGGIELEDAESANKVFIRHSVYRSVWGTGILTVGFICLFVSRLLETLLKEPGKYCLLHK